jgi:hypothetical protein
MCKTILQNRKKKKLCTCERVSIQKTEIKRMKQPRKYLKEMKGSITEKDLNKTVLVFSVIQDTLLTAVLFALQNKA